MRTLSHLHLATRRLKFRQRFGPGSCIPRHPVRDVLLVLDTCVAAHTKSNAPRPGNAIYEKVLLPPSLIDWPMVGRRVVMLLPPGRE